MTLSHKLVAQDIVFPGYETDYYVSSILKHALSYHPDKNYRLIYYNKNLPKKRVLKMVDNNRGIDIIAAGSTKERESYLLPIRFPILKGLHGWRISLVANDQIDLFSKILTLAEFKKLKAGQLHSWSDTKVLEGNGINVEKGSDYQGLFSMLANHRFDYFPRSIIEVDRELKQNEKLPISTDKKILIHYPTAYYFYVNKDNKTLADDILSGLEQSLADGSFEVILMKYYGEYITKVSQEKRKVFHLENPSLPSKTPLSRRELWLDFNNKH